MFRNVGGKKHDAGWWVPQKIMIMKDFLVGWVPQKIMIIYDFLVGPSTKVQMSPRVAHVTCIVRLFGKSP